MFIILNVSEWSDCPVLRCWSIGSHSIHTFNQHRLYPFSFLLHLTLKIFTANSVMSHTHTYPSSLVSVRCIQNINAVWTRKPYEKKIINPHCWSTRTAPPESMCKIRSHESRHAGAFDIEWLPVLCGSTVIRKGNEFSMDGLHSIVPHILVHITWPSISLCTFSNLEMATPMLCKTELLHMYILIDRVLHMHINVICVRVLCVSECCVCVCVWL